MKIELKKVTVRELTEGYKDSDEEGVVGFREARYSSGFPARVCV
ncbi:hypothetical protein [Akkermansia muciniphila]